MGTETLYIGFGINHPGGGIGMQTIQISSGSTEKSKEHLPEKSKESIVDSPPSVVGYSANVGQNGPFDFVGDFVFQVYYNLFMIIF